mmetsp:Transcript_118063/g.381047  ORF Transcript_118063/g.381047 Transcript_118063/m.381047 type:complete len:311 (+) Transcript_118063:241-1173(+)
MGTTRASGTSWTHGSGRGGSSPASRISWVMPVCVRQKKVSSGITAPPMGTSSGSGGGSLGGSSAGGCSLGVGLSFGGGAGLCLPFPAAAVGEASSSASFGSGGGAGLKKTFTASPLRTQWQSCVRPTSSASSSSTSKSSGSPEGPQSFDSSKESKGSGAPSSFPASAPSASSGTSAVSAQSPFGSSKRQRRAPPAQASTMGSPSSTADPSSWAPLFGEAAASSPSPAAAAAAAAASAAARFAARMTSAAGPSNARAPPSVCGCSARRRPWTCCPMGAEVARCCASATSSSVTGALSRTCSCGSHRRVLRR